MNSSDESAEGITATEASERARSNGWLDGRTTTFSVCPVCDGHFENVGPTALTEAVLRRHCGTHTAEEYLRTINRVRAEAVADALRSAADDLYSDNGPGNMLSTATWLRARAAGSVPVATPERVDDCANCGCPADAHEDYTRSGDDAPSPLGRCVDCDRCSGYERIADERIADEYAVAIPPVS